MSDAELTLTTVASAALACEWVRQYYAYEGLSFNAAVEQGVFQLLESSRFGWFFELTYGAEAIGYAVLTRAFDHEFGGEFAILTDFFLLERRRRHGHGSQALKLLEEFARSQSFHVLDLHVLNRNDGVKAFYAKRGFCERSDRRLMSKSLAN
ncbi:MAG: GNAT family N-acetyltransferase [Limisphaerales bacterium]